MNLTHEFWALAISLSGGIQCLLLASSFMLLKKGNLFAHRLFAIMIFLVGLRLFKSAWYIHVGDEIPLILMNVGFAAHLATGPLLVLYIWVSLFEKKIKRSWWVHFLPAIGIVIGANSLYLDEFWYRGAYQGLLILSMTYWLYALTLIWTYQKQRGSLNKAQRRWLLSLSFMMGTFFLVYIANYFLGLLPYSKAPLVYTFALFPLSLAAWKNYEVLTFPPLGSPVQKYQNLELSTKAILDYQQKITRFIHQERPYLTSGYSLKKLSEDTHIPSHIISLVLNQHLSISFTSLINRHRIDHACQLLADPHYDHFSIAGIAFESGFHSLSVFNQHFKKIKGMTPSVYRQEKGRA